jgi:HlyD family secretion protein
LQVEADVSESNIMRVSSGQRCEIALDAYPDRRYPGVVHKIVPTADRAKATVMVKVRFLEQDERVLPEMSAKVAFLSDDASEAVAGAPPKLMVPTAALLTRGESTVVLRVLDGIATELPVTTGERIGDRVAVTGAISDGDRLILNPHPSLTSGSRVQPRKP